jgi:hypothetical protein
MKKSLTPQKMCLDKIAYDSKEEANEELHYWKFEVESKNSLKVYKCPFCYKWHLGNSTRR